MNWLLLKLEIKIKKIGHVGKKEIIELNKSELYKNKFSLIHAIMQIQKRNLLIFYLVLNQK